MAHVGRIRKKRPLPSLVWVLLDSTWKFWDACMLAEGVQLNLTDARRLQRRYANEGGPPRRVIVMKPAKPDVAAEVLSQPPDVAIDPRRPTGPTMTLNGNGRLVPKS